ncbi:MAG: glycosyltransferase [Bryobacteraceae bacterium]|jgi:glycosyltransferase involved in cell wall biosynthesis
MSANLAEDNMAVDSGVREGVPGGSPIRVLVLLEAAAIDGVAKPILEFAREAVRLRREKTALEVSLAVFSRRGEPAEHFIRAVQECGVPLTVIRERHVFDFGVIPQLHSVVRSCQPDVIWTNGVKTHFLVRFSGLNKGCGWTAFHHGYTTTTFKTKLYNQLNRWSLRAADRVLTVCAAFAAELERNCAARERIRVQDLPFRPFPAISPDRAVRLRRELGLGEDTRVLVTIGRLSKEKGHADLIRAIARLRDRAPDLPCCLLVVGSGREEARLTRLCGKLGLEGAVRLVGYQEDVRPYLALADVFVLSSHSEGSPNVLLEAMAAEIPVVATSVGGVPEMMENEKHALLVPDRDVPALAGAIERVLRDSQLRGRLTSAGSEVVNRHAPETCFRSMVRNLLDRAVPD